MATMARSTREVEVKLAFPTAEAALAALKKAGAALVSPRSFEDNRVYDRGDGELQRAGLLLRLRTTGDRHAVTFKAPVAGEHRHKVRVEHETVVGDAEAMHRVLEGLGYRVAWRYQKYRTTLRLPGVEALVDETPIGCWVELEGEPEAIDRVAATLGFTPERYDTGTYRDLAIRHAASRGLPPRDLVFDEPA